MSEQAPHIPVMVDEVINLLLTDPTGVYVDGTVGYGGHACGILSRLEPGGFFIGLDRDNCALGYCEKFLSARFDKKSYSLHKINYKDFPDVLKEQQLPKVNGILLDLGISSINIDNSERGFSFQNDGPLDMRFDQSSGKSAAQYLSGVSELELDQVLWNYGEERFHKKIASAIVRKAAHGEMNTTLNLKRAIMSVVFGKYQLKSVARVFQAIRIKINDELSALSDVLDLSLSNLKKGGRIAVITFHSLEDRIVKNFFREKSQICVCPPEFPQCVCDTKALLKVINRKPIVPDPSEIERNSRSRSAKLRVAERV